MNKNGPIIVIEDDADDRELLELIFKKHQYPNEVIFFEDGEKALDYLLATDTNPFLILSDINMPKTDGFALRERVFTNKQLQLKCIPYLFFTTGVNKASVIAAYSLSVQGFFLKPDSFEKLSESIRKIVEYWQECYAPNQYI